jgi:hypothetical protein
MTDRDYFTVDGTSCTIPRRGAMAIFAGDRPRKNEDGSTSYPLRAPLLLMPPEMFENADEIIVKVARILNENAHEFFDSAKEVRASGVWPDFIAPQRYEEPHPEWTDPALPDFRLIWKVARECGYAVGLHGSMMRDCDLIAAPWTDEAVASLELIERLCCALGAKTVGPIAGKPHGRLGFILQSERWEKNIDLSVMPLAPLAMEVEQ